MKTVNKKRVFLIMSVVLLVLSACTPVKSGLSVTGSHALNSEANLITTDVQRDGKTGVTKDLQKDTLTINYNNCAQLYAVQPDDTLRDVARVSATTEEFVLTRNGLDSEDDLYPGLVLCLEDANGGGLIPPTGGGRSGVEVTNVSVDERVTVRGVDFQDNANINVYIFQQGVSNPDVVYLGAITIPSSGTFERDFRIPTELRAFRNLILRFRNPDENISATATFINASVDRVTPEECAEYYTVRSGDILGSIAQEVNVPVERLIELNNLVDANIVFPGQMLCTALK
jgi:hypothetical protein